MKRINRHFWIKSYAGSQFYCYYPQWTIKIINLFGYRFAWISIFGYEIAGFVTKKEANKFIADKKLEYFNAKRYINL